MTIAIQTLIDELDRIPECQLYGRVTSVLGTLDGIDLGCKAEVTHSEPAIWPTEA